MAKSGITAIIGRSNVGKSTLLNSLVGTKVAIMTPKPQTTRRPIQGVLNDPRGQAVFVDTPGIMQKAKDPLTKKLLNFAKSSLQDVELVIYLVDATREIGNEEKQTYKLIEGVTQPKLLVINKIDNKKSKEFIANYRDLGERFDMDVIEISALTRKNLNHLTDWIFKNLPEGVPLYPADQISNITKEEQLAELIREKLFLRLRQEVPYSTHVVVDEFFQKKNGTYMVRARILTSDERYKGMIIGAGGRGIEEIGRSTRRELETVTHAKWFIGLKVEVDKHWVERIV